MLNLALNCAIACAASMVSIQLLLRFWTVSVGVDHGDHFRKSQDTPILRVGGLAVLIGFLVATLLAKHWFHSLEEMKIGGLLLLSLAMFAVGFVDDIRGLPATLRLAFQVAIALTAYSLGFRIEGIDLPFLTRFDLQLLSLPVTVLWLVALPNIFNLADGMDGLVGGLGAIVFAVIGAGALSVGATGVAILAFIMTASIAGFLFFNLPPAKIYLGDGGAYLVGFFAALLAVESSQKGTAATVLLVVIAVLAYPIADTTFAICRRFIYGYPIFRSDAEHLHHRLVTLGLPRGWLLTMLYAMFLCLALGGIGMLLNRGIILPLVITAVGLCALGGFYTHAYRLSPRQLPDRIRRAFRARRRLRYAIRLSQVLEHELDFTPEAEVFWASFLESVRKAGLLPVAANAVSTEALSEEWTPFDVTFGSGANWRLAYRAQSTMLEVNWRKIAQCFLPVLGSAMKRWEAPHEIGVTTGPAPAPQPETQSVKQANKPTLVSPT